MCAQAAGPGLLPLDKQWSLDASVYSPELKRQLVWLSGLLPYAQAEAVLKRIGKYRISDSSQARPTAHGGNTSLRAVQGTRTAP